MEPGSLAEWVSAVFGLGLGGASLLIAWQANSQAKAADRRAAEAEQEMIRRQDALEERERKRDLLNVGSYLQAWWACKSNNDSNGPWGILVQNIGENSLLLHDVEITYSRLPNRDNPPIKWITNTIKCTVLPPGKYFYETTPKGSPKLPETVNNLSRFSAITHSGKHKVDSIRYSTPNRSRWKWTPTEGLQNISAREEQSSET